MSRFLVLELLCLFGCSGINQPPLKTHIVLMDKVDSVDLGFEVLHGKFYPLKLDLTNNTDSIYSFWTNSCSWQSNWIFESSSFTFVVDCPKNIPVLMKLGSKETITYHGYIQSSDTSALKEITEDRLGFILINKSELNTYVDFISILRTKIESKKDIYWTNIFTIKR